MRRSSFTWTWTPLQDTTTRIEVVCTKERGDDGKVKINCQAWRLIHAKRQSLAVYGALFWHVELELLPRLDGLNGSNRKLGR